MVDQGSYVWQARKLVIDNLIDLYCIVRVVNLAHTEREEIERLMH